VNTNGNTTGSEPGETCENCPNHWIENYPLVITHGTLWKFNIAIENDHRNSGFSHKQWWIFPVRYVSLPHGNGKSAVNFEFFFVWEKHPNDGWWMFQPCLMMMTPEGISHHIIYYVISYHIILYHIVSPFIFHEYPIMDIFPFKYAHENSHEDSTKPWLNPIKIPIKIPSNHGYIIEFTKFK